METFGQRDMIWTVWYDESSVLIQYKYNLSGGN